MYHENTVLYRTLRHVGSKTMVNMNISRNTKRLLQWTRDFRHAATAYGFYTNVSEYREYRQPCVRHDEKQHPGCYASSRASFDSRRRETFNFHFPDVISRNSLVRIIILYRQLNRTVRVERVRETDKTISRNAIGDEQQQLYSCTILRTFVRT